MVLHASSESLADLFLFSVSLMKLFTIKNSL